MIPRIVTLLVLCASLTGCGEAPESAAAREKAEQTAAEVRAEIARAREQARSEMQASLENKPSAGDIGSNAEAAVATDEAGAGVATGDAEPAADATAQPSGIATDAPPDEGQPKEADPAAPAASDTMPAGEPDTSAPGSDVPTTAVKPDPASNTAADGD